MKKLNIGIVAHVDAGKTTLTENILYLGGAIPKVGRVDSGSTQTDSMEVERRRGISVRAAATSFERNGIKHNLIDTPGHVDFVAEVERSLRVLDGVVLVVSAKEGVQSGTRILSAIIAKERIPAVVFINKTDRIGADPAGVAAQLNSMLGGRLVECQEVLEDGGIRGYSERELQEQNEEAMCSLCDMLMEKYVSEAEIPAALFMESLSKLAKSGQAYPVFFGSALRGIGVGELLDALPTFLPCAEDDEELPLSGVVFKVDTSADRQCFVRLYQGKLELRGFAAVHGQNVKIRRLSGISNGKTVALGKAGAGDIAILFMKELRVGDTVGEPSKRARNISLGKPTLLVEVLPVRPHQVRELYDYLALLADEDPMLDLSGASFAAADGQGLTVRMFGEVQMEVLGELLAERFDCPVSFLDAGTIYAEAPAKTATAIWPIKRKAPFPAGVGFRVEPLPRGSGLHYVSDVSLGELTKSFQNAVEAAVLEACKNGVYGWEVTDCRVAFVYSDYDSVMGTPSAFRDLTPLALMEAFGEAGMELLEPILEFSLRVPENALSRALYDCQQMGASGISIENEHGFMAISGLVPAAACKGYSVKVASYTEGRGSFTAKFHGYETTQAAEDKINIKGINPAVNKGLYLLQKMGAKARN